MYLISNELKKAIRDIKKKYWTEKTIVYNKLLKRIYLMEYIRRPPMSKQAILSQVGIPGWLVCAWCMDKPVTEYWKDKVIALGKVLKVRKSKCLERIK